MRRKLLIGLLLACATALPVLAAHLAEHATTWLVTAGTSSGAGPRAVGRSTPEERLVWTVENQPLDRPVRVVALRPPATAHLADGSAVEVYGLRLITPLDLAAVARLARLPNENVEVEVAKPAATASRMDLKCGGVAICGNTRGAVPRYHRRDLADVLVMQGAALPTLSVARDAPDYAASLLKALQTGIMTRNIYRDINLAGDAEAARLGEHVLQNYPGMELAGIWLLAKARDQRVHTAAVKRADTLVAAGLAGNSYETGQRRLELGILAGLVGELGGRATWPQ